MGVDDWLVPVSPQPNPAPSWRVMHRALGPGIRHDARWRAGFVAAWVVGAFAGVAPTAFQGYPAPGLAASALLGLVAVALTAPLVMLTLVALITTDDDAEQASVSWLGLGAGPARRLMVRSLAAMSAGLRLLPVGAAGGLVAGVGLAATRRDPLSLALAGAPRPAAMVLGAGLVVLAGVLGGLLGAAAVTPARVVLVLVGSWLVTGAVASLVYFSPDLAGVFPFTPWMALRPFDPQSSASAQFAASLPLATRLLGGAGWSALLGAVAVVRRWRTPYPRPGERRPGRCRRPPGR